MDDEGSCYSSQLYVMKGTVHCKKGYRKGFPFPSGRSLAKLSLAGNNYSKCLASAIGAEITLITEMTKGQR
jgi:hypothetical protein